MRSAIAIWFLIGCGSSEPDKLPLEFGGDDRPVTLKTPAELDEGREYPLVLVLHGYGSNGFAHAAFFQLSGLPAENEALLLAPDGTFDASGKQFWNADPACCDFFGAAPDDVGYLATLLEDVIDAWPVDRSQVFVVGHSNGAFMGYRMACEHADLITASALLAGNTSAATGACAPSEPTSMLVMHGTADDVVTFDGTAPGGGPVQQVTIGAIETRARWAQYDGCSGTMGGVALELEQGAADDNETEVLAGTGCPAGIGVDLWTHEGVGHVPVYSPVFKDTLWTWLQDHARP